MHVSAYPVEHAACRSTELSKRLSPSIVSGIVGFLDALSVLAPGVVIHAVYVGWQPQSLQLYLSAISITTFVIISAFYIAGLYKFEVISHLATNLKKAIKICAIIWLSMVALTFALKISEQFSRVWAFSWFFTATLSICASRSTCYFTLLKSARSGRLTRNIVIVGAGEQAKRLITRLGRSEEPWNVIVGVFDDRVGRTGTEFSGLPVLGTIHNLVEFARNHRTDDVIVALPWSAEARIHEIVTQLEELPVHVHLGSDLIGFDYPSKNYSPFAGVTVLRLAVRPLAGWKKVIKAFEDKLLASLLVIAFSPLLGIIALAVKLDSPGPILFRQPRFGFNNRAFSVFKFRTMYDNGLSENNAVPQATKDDPRVTRVGRVLRKTSLDELPQLLNVLQGTMSMVGPRPHAVPHNEHYSRIIRGYFSRHRVKPGITGWAQINGLRGETDIPEKMKVRVEHDIWYIENWSLLRDLYILFKTAYVVWFQRTAY